MPASAQTDDRQLQYPLRLGRVLNRAICHSFADVALPEGIHLPVCKLHHRCALRLPKILVHRHRINSSCRGHHEGETRHRRTMNFNVRESATTARCSRRKTPWALLLPGCPPRGCPDFNPAPASPRLLALGSLPRWAAPAIYDLPGLCPLTRPSSWTSDLWEPWCWRTSSPVASCRQRFDAGSRAPLRDTGGGGLRPPYETSRLGTPFRLPANLIGAPQPTADPARAG